MRIIMFLPATTCDHQLTSSSSVNSPVFFKRYQMPSTTIKIATMSIAILVILSPPACLTELVEGGDPTSIPPNPPLNRPQLEYFANIFSNIFLQILTQIFSNISSAGVLCLCFSDFIDHETEPGARFSWQWPHCL